MDLLGCVSGFLHLLPLSCGVLPSLGFCLHNFRCLFVGKWSLLELILFHLTSLFYPDRRAQQFPGAGARPGEKEGGHSLLEGCSANQLINSLLTALLNQVQLKEDTQCVPSLS